MSSAFFTSHQLAIQEQSRVRAQEMAKDQPKLKQQEETSESKIKLPDGGSVDVLFGDPILYGKSTSIEQMSALFHRASGLPNVNNIQAEILMIGGHWQELVDRTTTHLSANNSVRQLQVMMLLPKLGLLNLSAEYMASHGWKLNLSAENSASTQALLKHRRNLCRKICAVLDDRVELSIGDMKYEQHD